MTELEMQIQELENRLKKDGLSNEDKLKLAQLQEEWFKVKSAKYGGCLNCFI